MHEKLDERVGRGKLSGMAELPLRHYVFLMTAYMTLWHRSRAQSRHDQNDNPAAKSRYMPVALLTRGSDMLYLS